MGDNGIFAVRDGTGSDLQWTWHGWRFAEGRPTRLGALLWRAVHLKGLDRTAAEGPATPGRARTVTHEQPDPREHAWLYVVNPHLKRMALFVAVPAPALPDRQARHLGLSSGEGPPVKVGAAWYYSSREGFTYELLGSWDLRRDRAPDWKALEERGRVKRATDSGAAALPAEENGPGAADRARVREAR